MKSLKLANELFYSPQLKSVDTWENWLLHALEYPENTNEFMGKLQHYTEEEEK